jgi:hypothetical protein
MFTLLFSHFNTVEWCLHRQSARSVGCQKLTFWQPACPHHQRSGKFAGPMIRYDKTCALSLSLTHTRTHTHARTHARTRTHTHTHIHIGIILSSTSAPKSILVNSILQSQPSSWISIVSACKLDDQCFIPSRGRWCFLYCPDWLWGPSSLLHNGYW